MSATRQSQQSPPSTESRSSSKASWAAKKSPALKSRTPAPKPGESGREARPPLYTSEWSRARPPEGRSDRLAGPPRGGAQAAFLLPWLSNRIQIEEAAEDRPRHVVRPRLWDQAVPHMSSRLLSLDFLRRWLSTEPRAVKGARGRSRGC